MIHGTTRREALQRLGVTLLCVGLPPLGAGCALSDAEFEERLTAGLVELSGTRVAPAAIASAAPTSKAQALAKLRGEASLTVLRAATSSGVALRAWLARSRDADLREGRVRWVNGWLLTETEIAAAALAAG